MNLNPFLTEIFEAFMKRYNPLEGSAKLAKRLTDLREEVAELEKALGNQATSEDEIKKFLLEAESLLSGHVSEAVLNNMLLARFGGDVKQQRAKKANGGSASVSGAKSSSNPVTADEKKLVSSVLTKEPMSITEIAAAITQHTTDTWLSHDVSPILRAMLEEGVVNAQGERRGKRYFLA